ncbi:hypothetical protein GIY23_03365 [Allosaccharopolyspora coralli]|uniref:Redoxin family protein n=1 Tax=Allosaccharopolyspora coralli TaxID=2665642 RepID=A0A5Q3Q2A5_9PSEU|nr:hypothetical protein [Allosaccharopolyspora coralli]QGK68718.1 hypothetical protein GIY23_03365 [Allosaccharopolyspora coralli]
MTVPRPRRVHGVVALVLLAGLGVAGCGTSTPPQTGAGSAPQQQTTAGHTGTVTALDGTKLTIPATGRVTVAYFFAPGCVTCVPATKQLARAQQQTGQQARFVALNLIPDVPAGSVRSFLRSAGDPQVPVVKNGVPLARAQQVTSLGTTIVYGPNGQEVFRGVDASAGAITTAIQKARS